MLVLPRILETPPMMSTRTPSMSQKMIGGRVSSCSCSEKKSMKSLILWLFSSDWLLEFGGIRLRGLLLTEDGIPILSPPPLIYEAISVALPCVVLVAHVSHIGLTNRPTITFSQELFLFFHGSTSVLHDLTIRFEVPCFVLSPIRIVGCP